MVDDVELRLLKQEVIYQGLLKSDREYHQKINNTISMQVKQTEREMIELQQELEEQRALKSLKSDYEAIAKEIMAFESQTIILGKLNALKAEIASLEEMSKSEEIVRRQRQLHTLVCMIQDLKGEVAMLNQ